MLLYFSVDECRIYCFDDSKLEVQVDFNQTNYIKTIQHLCQATGWDEMDFRIKEYRPSSFSLYGLIPGQKIMNKGPVNNGNRISTIGVFVCAAGENAVYALTVAHVFPKGQQCYLEDELYIGECVEVVECKNSPTSFDLAIIKIDDDHAFIDNIIFSSKGIPCTFRFPSSEQEVRDMELWKVQRKAHGTWQYGYFRHSCYTNKDHGIYRARTVVRAHEMSPYIREGECGSLVTSLPRDGQLTVHGMLNGCIIQEADDGGDPIELYTSFPLQEALQKSQTFANKALIFHAANLDEGVFTTMY